MMGEIWSFDGFNLGFLGISLGLPLLGGIAKGIGSAFGAIKGEKRKDTQEGFTKEELALQRERFEEDKRQAKLREGKQGAFFGQAKERFLDRPEPGREDLSGLYSSNPFVGGARPLGASAAGAGGSLGFEMAPPATGGPIQAPPSLKGPGRGEVLPSERFSDSKNVGDDFLKGIKATDIRTGQALEPGKAHRGTVETNEILKSLFGRTGTAQGARDKAAERFRLPGRESIRGRAR